MAQVEENKGGRSSNIDLNLVPFIDLMSVLITFLLITAVWTQVSMIQLGSSIYAKKNTTENPEPPKETPDIVLRLDVKESGYLLVVGKKRIDYPRKANRELDNTRLIDELKKVKESFPTKNDAVISMVEQLPYENLISGMDALLQSGFTAVNIATFEVQ